MQTIGIRTGYRTEPRRPSWVAQYVEGMRRRREERARRAHALRANGARASYVPGSEHTHIIRPRGF